MIKDLNIRISEEKLNQSAADFFTEYFKDLVRAFGWQEQTQKSYGYYMSQLEPFLTEIPFKDCAPEDFDEAIAKVNPARRASGKRVYSLNTLKSFRSIINDICYFVEVYSGGFYQSTLWGCGWNTEQYGSARSARKTDYVKEKQKKIDRQVRLQRSLSIPQEIKLIQKIDSTLLINSYCIGVAIMFYMGLRPGECCGVKFGDIQRLNGYSETQCMRIYEQITSSESATNKLKTENAYRILPVPSELAEMIDRRGYQVVEILGDDISDCYIVCDGNDRKSLTLPCTRRKFSNFCTKLLRDISVEESVVENLSSMLKGSDVSESNATSYLLRRNFATDLVSVCGMEDDEVKYEMGHAIYIPDERRRDFLNPDTLHRLWEKLNRRRFDLKGDSCITLDDDPLVLRQTKASIEVTEDVLARSRKGVYLDVWNENPNDYIRVRLESGEPSALQYRSALEPVKLTKAARVKIHHEFAEAVRQSSNRIK